MNLPHIPVAPVRPDPPWGPGSPIGPGPPWFPGGPPNPGGPRLPAFPCGPGGPNEPITNLSISIYSIKQDPASQKRYDTINHSANGSTVFIWMLCYHWLKHFRQLTCNVRWCYIQITWFITEKERVLSWCQLCRHWPLVLQSATKMALWKLYVFNHTTARINLTIYVSLALRIVLSRCETLISSGGR